MPIAKQSGEGKKYEPVAAGVHQGVCVGIFDIGTQPSKDPKFKSSRKVWITWELPHETVDTDEGPKPRLISEKYTLSMHKKGRLLPMLQSWRGTPFSAEELKGFDLAKLIGRNCQLNVVHSEPTADGKVYANISAVIPLPKGMAPVPPSGKTTVYDIPEAGAITVPDTVPEWIKKQIEGSIEWKERMGAAKAVEQEVDKATEEDERPF